MKKRNMEKLRNPETVWSHVSGHGNERHIVCSIAYYGGCIRYTAARDTGHDFCPHSYIRALGDKTYSRRFGACDNRSAVFVCGTPVLPEEGLCHRRRGYQAYGCLRFCPRHLGRHFPEHHISYLCAYRRAYNLPFQQREKTEYRYAASRAVFLRGGHFFVLRACFNREKLITGGYQ